MKKATLKPDDKEQSKLFLRKAREIDADEEYSASDDLLRQLASMPPEPKTKKTAKKASAKVVAGKPKAKPSKKSR